MAPWYEVRMYIRPEDDTLMPHDPLEWLQWFRGEDPKLVDQLRLERVEPSGRIALSSTR